MDTQEEQADQFAALVGAVLPASEPTGPEPQPGDANSIVTKEHRRFTEFADAVRRNTSACALARPASARPSPLAARPAGMSWKHSYRHPIGISPRAGNGPTGTPCFTHRPSAPPRE